MADRLGSQDELLSWHRCGACQHVFLPDADRVVACPECGALHMPDETLLGWDRETPAQTVHTWLVAHGWPGFYHLCRYGRRDFYFMGDRRAIVPLSGTVHLPDTERLLEERGEVRDAGGQEPYLVFWLSSVWMGPPSTAQQHDGERIWREQVSGLRSPERTPVGLCLRLTGDEALRAESLGTDRVARALAEAARALGGSGYRRLRPSPVAGALHTAAPRRSVRCTACGAPVAPNALVRDGTACPYCGSSIAVPAALRAEVDGYGRRLAALDARWTFQPAAFFSQLGAHSASAVVACPVCGAPADRAPGEAFQRCGHCGAGVVPPPEVLDHDVALAHADADAIQRARARELRRKHRAQHRAAWIPAAVAFAGILGANLLVVPLTISGGFLDAVASQSSMGATELKAYACSGVFSCSLLLTLGFGIVLATLRFRRAAEARRWAPVFAHIAEQLGTGVTDLAEAHAWRERHWPVELAPMRAKPDGRAAAFLFQPGGLPCLVETVAPTGIRILMAIQWKPEAGTLKDSEGVMRRREALAEAGFTTVLRRGGIEANAYHKVGPVSLEQPRAQSVVVPVVFELRRIASLLGS